MNQKYLDKLEFNIIIEKLVNLCNTFDGKEIAENLKPYSNDEKIKKELRETNDGFSLINSYGYFPIGIINDNTLNLKKIESEIPLSQKSLLEIADILKNSRELNLYKKEIEKDFDLSQNSLIQYFDELYENKDIESEIFKCIISEDEISDNASPKLSSIRKNIKSMEIEIRNKLNSIIHSNTYSKYIQEKIITIRSGRFVIPVLEEYKNYIKGFIHDTSNSGSTVYIEPISIFDINNKIGDLKIEEKKEIERILAEISSKLFSIQQYIKKDLETISKFDFIMAKVKLSNEQNAVEPEISNYVEFTRARHPLIDNGKVVPINIYFGYKKDKFNYKTLVITGPNMGGKTVTLKTVGLLCLMAQSGLNIPCEKATIKIFDNIFADIGDEQSIEENLSTFSSHITNIVKIIKEFSKDSLILVDELGSGTDPIEGENLAISLLEYFNKMGCLTLATTHYQKIKEYCILNKGFENASCEFDIATLKSTYNILIGIPGKSNAFAISEKLGVPKEIIFEAKNLVEEKNSNFEDLLKEIYDDKKEIEKMKLEEEKNLNQVTLLRKELEKQNNEKLNNELKKIENAKYEAKEILLDAKEQADDIIKNLNRMNQNDLIRANNLRNQLNSSISKLGGNELNLSSLIKLNSKYEKNLSSSGSTSIKNMKAQNTSTEINVIGENVSSATMIIDKYLDNCKMANLKNVRIVHGKGTGKLRQGIQEYLKTSKYVKDFHIADYGEGDYGVTIVTLK